jgi:hypothetical protein
MPGGLREEAYRFGYVPDRVPNQWRRHDDSPGRSAFERGFKQLLLLPLGVNERFSPRAATGEQQVFALLA